MKEVIESLQSVLESERNEFNAPKMAAYMKGNFPFLGLTSTHRKQVTKPWLQAVRKGTPEERWTIAFALWELPEREYHYVAMEVLGTLKQKEYQPTDDQRIQQLISTQSWWDSVDFLASTILGSYLMQFPEKRKAVCARFLKTDDMWLHRSTIIFQLKYRNEVDTSLLAEVIERKMDHKTFFIQKAIGWSLRQYSKFNPAWVETFLEEHTLSNLAVREASKYL